MMIISGVNVFPQVEVVLMELKRWSLNIRSAEKKGIDHILVDRVKPATYQAGQEKLDELAKYHQDTAIIGINVPVNILPQDTLREV
jgi:hypothetical protein